jgi:hypothetical protein
VAARGGLSIITAIGGDDNAARRRLGAAQHSLHRPGRS